MGLSLVYADNNNVHEWNNYIASRYDSTFTDKWEWNNILQNIYGFEQFWLLAKNNNRVVGCAALALADHPIFGKYLVTAPFGSYGGFYFDTDEAHAALIQKIEELKYILGTRYALIRIIDNGIKIPPGWINDSIYSTYMIEIRDDPQQYLQHVISRKTRACIRNSMNRGCHVSFGHKELLDDFWYVVSRAMKELGSPFHSRRYLKAVLDTLQDNVKINIIYSKDSYPCAAGLHILHNDQVDFLYGPKLNKYRSLNIGEFLYWSIIEYYFQNGFRKLNLGRSLIGSNNENFKMKWRPAVRNLASMYYVSPGDSLPGLNQANPKFKNAIKMWQRMPLWTHRVVGPKVISGVL
jgi:serine/alanine adding enzyme